MAVELANDHPGFSDPRYRARRDEIAAISAAWVKGTPPPRIDYTADEHEVWRTCARELRARRGELVCTELLDSEARLALPDDHVPQLADASAGVESLSGFRLHPVAGLAPAADFFRALGDRDFYSTQYLRHRSVPLYTPEPDLVHELLGHAVQLASPRFAEINRACGEAAQRITTPEAMALLGRVHWFTIEFGAFYERGQLRAYGAGLLSSFGELERLHTTPVRELDVRDMATIEFRIDEYQPAVYAAHSLDHLEDELLRFFGRLDDETPAELELTTVG
jgi:phenylalanine-4-hydroxylase